MQLVVSHLWRIKNTMIVKENKLPCLGVEDAHTALRVTPLLFNLIPRNCSNVGNLHFMLETSNEVIN